VKPILTNTANLVLKGPEGSDVMDLPVTRITYGDGKVGVESCWKLDQEELEEVKRTGNIYFICMAPTHPPICLSPYSSLTGKVDGQYDTEVNPLEVPCPRCGVRHDTKNYVFLYVDHSHEEEPSWYQCPSCGGKFHSLEV